MAEDPLKTPDGRYLVVHERLWRCSDPSLPANVRQKFIMDLMNARRAVAKAKSPEELKFARKAVDDIKRNLGERGPVWWLDGEPDYTNRKIQNTPYASWFASRVPSKES